MNNDRYQGIRDALSNGPTPGEWYWSDAYRTPDGRKTWSLIGDRGFGILSCDGEENSPQSVNAAAAELIAACDPDTIRALLGERDALAAENARLREALREARDAIEDWAGYASDYFREKHDLAGDLAKVDALLRDQEEGK